MQREGRKKKVVVLPVILYKVFFDITIDDAQLGRLEFDLFAETPKTSENFRCLCTGEKGIGK